MRSVRRRGFGDIAVSGDTVSWLGGDDGYRRFVLHHAALAQSPRAVSTAL
jgi:hypothetical protein